MRIILIIILMSMLRLLPGSATATSPTNATTIQRPPVLDERLMTTIVEAATLSALVYKNATDDNRTLSSHPRYEAIRFYGDHQEAIVAKRHGRCYLAFRGTMSTVEDWLQNIGLASVDVYLNNNRTLGESCNARKGYADGLQSDWFARATADLEDCVVSTCADDPPMDCLVLTGHSKGGAEATLAAIGLDRFRPTLITFGQPLSVSRDCHLIQSDRVYRFVNSVFRNGRNNELDYDPVPFAPAAGQGRGHFGYFLLLGEDTGALKFLGVDGEDSDFSPGRQTWTTAHTMAAENGMFSYQARIQALHDNGVFPVSIQGFSGGVPCDDQNQLVCASNECHAERLLCADRSTTEAPRTASCAALSGGYERTAAMVLALFSLTILWR